MINYKMSLIYIENNDDYLSEAETDFNDNYLSEAETEFNDD
jgi:hypothetical protein